MKTMTVVKISVDGAVEAAEVQGFPGLREMVGGYVEIIPGTSRVPGTSQLVAMLADEDGGPKDLAINETASAITAAIYPPGWVIRGPAVFIGSCEESFCSLTDESVAAILAVADGLG